MVESRAALYPNAQALGKTTRRCAVTRTNAARVRAMSRRRVMTAVVVLAFPAVLLLVLVTLLPGVYTAVISGANATTGVALVEVYEVE